MKGFAVFKLLTHALVLSSFSQMIVDAELDHEDRLELFFDFAGRRLEKRFRPRLVIRVDIADRAFGENVRAFEFNPSR